MMDDKLTLTFQTALHYLPKIALRIESLYEQIGLASHMQQAMVHHLALLQTLEMLKLIEKPELKSRFLKELMRLDYVFSRSTTSLPEQLIQDLHQHTHVLSHMPRHYAESIFQDPLLQSIRLGQSHSNQDIELDAPVLLFWLDTQPEIRQQQLSQWLKDLNPIYHTVKLYLALLRCRALFEKICIQHGFYQKAISDKKTEYLILFRIDKSLKQVPKIQVGYHGLSIRLCDAITMKELNNVESVFELAICQLN